MSIVTDGVRYVLDWAEEDTHDGNYSTIYAALTGPAQMMKAVHPDIIDGFLEDAIEEPMSAAEVRKIKAAIYKQLSRNFPKFVAAVRRGVKDLG
jgi:hypothetical protein